MTVVEDVVLVVTVPVLVTGVMVVGVDTFGAEPVDGVLEDPVEVLGAPLDVLGAPLVVLGVLGCVVTV